MTNDTKLIKNVNVYSPKTAHCYRITSKKVGTRNRVTMKDIYGNSHRASVLKLVEMTPYEASIVSLGERITRRKDAMTITDKLMSGCYKKFVKHIEKVI